MPVRSGARACSSVVLLLSIVGLVSRAAALEWTESFGDERGFKATGAHPFWSLEPGHAVTLAGKDGKDSLELVIAVLPETRTVTGVACRVIEERETVNGKLVEISRNFFAIGNRTGSVWYFGEDVDNYKDGKIVDHGSAWLAGGNGAKAGVFLPGLPTLGSRFYQEIAPGQAMDRGEIVSLDETVKTPGGTFAGCLKLVETTPLEPGTESVKLFAPGVGMVGDDGLRLTAVKTPK